MTIQRDAPYCPVPAPLTLRRGLARGRYRVSDLGLERLCTACDTYWPADTEFFPPGKRDGIGLHNWCRACYMERRRAREGRAQEVA